VTGATNPIWRARAVALTASVDEVDTPAY